MSGALQYEPQRLRNLIVNSADEHPIVKGMYILEGEYDLEPRKINLVPIGGDDWKVVEPSDGLDGSENKGQERTCQLQLGPAAAGRLIFASIDPSFVVKGSSSAPLLASLLAFAGKHWSLDIPRLIPSPDFEHLMKVTLMDK